MGKLLLGQVGFVVDRDPVFAFVIDADPTRIMSAISVLANQLSSKRGEGLRQAARWTSFAPGPD
jgi:hypothetical protein